MTLLRITFFAALLAIIGLSACNNVHVNTKDKEYLSSEGCESYSGTLPPGAIDHGNCGYKYLYTKGDAIDLSLFPAQSPVIPQGGVGMGDVFIRAFAPQLSEAPMSGVLFVVKNRAEAIFNAGTNINVDPAFVNYDRALISIPLSGAYPKVICVITEEQLLKKMTFPKDMPANFNKGGAVWIK